MSVDDVVRRIPSGCTVGIGGWGSRRKPMALVRALANSQVTDLTVVSYGGPDVGMLLAAGKVRRLVAGFVTLDSHTARTAFPAGPDRRRGCELVEWDEGMFQWGLLAAAHRLPFLPIRAGLGSDVLVNDPTLRTITSPYADAEELVGGTRSHAGRCTGSPESGRHPRQRTVSRCRSVLRRSVPVAADKGSSRCERIVPTAELLEEGPLQSLRIPRLAVTGVVETPHGAHFTTAAPDYERDEAFQKEYVRRRRILHLGDLQERFLAGDEQAYQDAVDTFHAENGSNRP